MERKTNPEKGKVIEKEVWTALRRGEGDDRSQQKSVFPPGSNLGCRTLWHKDPLGPISLSSIQPLPISCAGTLEVSLDLTGL